MKRAEEYSGLAKEIVEEIEKMFERFGKLSWEEIKDRCEQATLIGQKRYPAYIYLGLYEHDMKDYDRMDGYFLKGLEVADHPYNQYMWDSVIMTLDDVGLQAISPISSEILREAA